MCAGEPTASSWTGLAWVAWGSLGARRSTVTHVAAVTDKPNFQRILLHVVLVGGNQLNEAKLAAILANKPECAHVSRYNSGWMSLAIMARYVRLLGRCLKGFQTAYRSFSISMHFQLPPI